jgi:hypothetical protein
MIFLYIILIAFSPTVFSMENPKTAEHVSSQTVRRLQNLPVDVISLINTQLTPKYVIKKPEGAKIITSPNEEHSITHQMESNFFKAMAGDRNLIIKSPHGEISIPHKVPFSPKEREKYKKWLPTFITNQGWFILNDRVVSVCNTPQLYMRILSKLSAFRNYVTTDLSNSLEYTDIHPCQKKILLLEKPTSASYWTARTEQDITCKAHILTINEDGHKVRSFKIPTHANRVVFTPDNPDILLLEKEDGAWVQLFLTKDWEKTPLDSITQTHFVHKVKPDPYRAYSLALDRSVRAWLQDPNRSADEGKNLLTIFMKTPLQKRDNESDAAFKRRKNTHRFKIIWESTTDKNYKNSIIYQLKKKVEELSH